MRDRAHLSIAALSVLIVQLAVGSIIVAQRRPAVEQAAIDQAVSNERMLSIGARVAALENAHLDTRLSVNESSLWRIEKLLYGVILAALGNMVIAALQIQRRRTSKGTGE